MGKMYCVTHFKKVPGSDPYGAKTFIGNLDRAHKRLVKMYGSHALVRVLAPGHYSIADGAAELKILR